MKSLIVSSFVAIGALLMVGTWSRATQVAAAADDNLECLADLEIPRFAVINRTPAGGTVHGEVLLGASGRISQIVFRGTDRNLEMEVEQHLRNGRYRSGCEGRKVKLEFEFRVEGEPSYDPTVKTHFCPPNRFVITSGPLKPTADFLAAPPGAKGKKK